MGGDAWSGGFRNNSTVGRDSEKEERKKKRKKKEEEVSLGEHARPNVG
jgi:hypothetical protein